MGGGSRGIVAGANGEVGGLAFTAKESQAKGLVMME